MKAVTFFASKITFKILVEAPEFTKFYKIKEKFAFHKFFLKYTLVKIFIIKTLGFRNVRNNRDFRIYIVYNFINFAIVTFVKKQNKKYTKCNANKRYTLEMVLNKIFWFEKHWKQSSKIT